MAMKLKRWSRWVAAGLGLVWLLCVITVFYLNHVSTIRYRYLNFADPVFTHVRAHLQTQGPTPETQQLLARIPKQYQVVAFYVSDDGPGLIPPRPVIVGDRPELAGQPEDQISRELLPGHLLWTSNEAITGPDGKIYWLKAIIEGRQTHPVAQIRLAVITGVFAFAIAWVALAVWLLLDARERTPLAAPAWGLLGLLTGPIGVGVYLVVRPSPELCPGCGETLEPGGPFCPHCGHALKPACPDCRQPVAYTWHYCRSCGASLTES